MLKWGFIKGSQYNLTLFDNTKKIKENTTSNINFTLNNLSPGERYLICVTLITTDTDSRPPWPSCKNFITKQGTCMHIMYSTFIIIQQELVSV